MNGIATPLGVEETRPAAVLEDGHLPSEHKIHRRRCKKVSEGVRRCKNGVRVTSFVF